MSSEPLQYILSKEEWDYFRTCEQEREQLAAQNEALRSALEVIAGERQCCDNFLSNLDVARYALNLPNLSAEVLKRRDADALRRAADRFDSAIYTGNFGIVLRLWAAEIEKEPT